MKKQIDYMLKEYEAAVEILERKPGVQAHQTFCRGASSIAWKACGAMTKTQVERLKKLDARAFE